MKSSRFPQRGCYFDHDHRDMHIYGNIACLKSNGKRGTGFLYKIGSQAKNPQSIECYNNVAAYCNTGFQFVSAQPDKGQIENNVCVSCKAPWLWRVIKNGKEAAAPAEYASGKNIAYEDNGGFADPSHLDFHLKPNAPLLSDLPGFTPIPVEKIGLYVDEYRPKLPTDDEIDRFDKRRTQGGPGYDVEDRK